MTDHATWTRFIKRVVIFPSLRLLLPEISNLRNCQALIVWDLPDHLMMEEDV